MIQTYAQRARRLENKYPRSKFDQLDKEGLEQELDELATEQESFKTINDLYEPKEDTAQYADGGEFYLQPKVRSSTFSPWGRRTPPEPIVPQQISQTIQQPASAISTYSSTFSPWGNRRPPEPKVSKNIIQSQPQQSVGLNYGYRHTQPYQPQYNYIGRPEVDGVTGETILTGQQQEVIPQTEQQPDYIGRPDGGELNNVFDNNERVNRVKQGLAPWQQERYFPAYRTPINDSMSHDRSHFRASPDIRKSIRGIPIYPALTGDIWDRAPRRIIEPQQEIETTGVTPPTAEESLPRAPRGQVVPMAQAPAVGFGESGQAYDITQTMGYQPEVLDGNMQMAEMGDPELQYYEGQRPISDRSDRTSIIPSLASGAASVLGNLWLGRRDKRPEKLSPAMYRPNRLNLEGARQAVRSQGTLASNIARRNIRNMAGTRGAALANIGATEAQIRRGVGESLAGITTQEQMANVQSANEAARFNAQSRMAADAQNIASRDAWRQRRLGYEGAALGAIPQTMRDIRQTRFQDRQLQQNRELEQSRIDMLRDAYSKYGNLMFGANQQRG